MILSSDVVNCKSINSSSPSELLGNSTSQNRTGIRSAIELIDLLCPLGTRQLDALD